MAAEPTGEEPGAQPFPPAVVAAIGEAALALDADAAEVLVIDYEQVDWSDSCLGLGGPAESCLAAITPGWRVELSVAGEMIVARTDELGTQVRLE